MKRALIIAVLLFGLGGGPAAAQEFILTPEPDPNAILDRYSCEELDQEIQKARRYIKMVGDQVAFIGGDAVAEAGQFVEEDSMARDKAIDQASGRLAHLESVRSSRGCPGQAPE